MPIVRIQWTRCVRAKLLRRPNQIWSPQDGFHTDDPHRRSAEEWREEPAFCTPGHVWEAPEVGTEDIVKTTDLPGNMLMSFKMPCVKGNVMVKVFMDNKIAIVNTSTTSMSVKRGLE